MTRDLVKNGPMMKAAKALFATAMAVAVSAGPALAADACLMKSQIRSWTVPDNRHLIVEDSASHKFNVALLGACTGLQFTETLAVDTSGPGLCVEKGDAILFRQSSVGLGQRCMISDIQPVSG